MASKSTLREEEPYTDIFDDDANDDNNQGQNDWDDGNKDIENSEDEAEYGDGEEEEDYDNGDDEEEEEEEEEEELEEEEGPDLVESEPKDSNKRNNDLDFNSVQSLVNMISRIKLVWPENLYGFNEDVYSTDPSRAGFPTSYIHCTAKEKAVLWHAENFRRQFQFHFPSRRPLFLCPRNECGVQKLLPTYIKPRLVGYIVFVEAETCAEFLKDFLAPVFLKPPTDVPCVVRSHVAIFKDRFANTYEHSIIMASILIGAGYNAYVVDGFASSQITKLSTTAEFVDDFDEGDDHFAVDPELKEKNAEKAEEDEAEEAASKSVIVEDDEENRPTSPSKYRIRQKKVFRSAYETKMQAREDEKREQEEAAAREEAEQEAIKNYRPPTPDKLHGYRVHAWLLIVPGTREVTEPFFLEPFTGSRFQLSDQNFLGIETIFNHRNLYVNLQSCEIPLGKLSYDFEDKACWAKLLIEPPVKKKKEKNQNEPATSFEDEEEEEPAVPEMYLDLPVSWTKDMYISPDEYRLKYPKGSKTFEFTDAIVEVASPYVMPDGLIRKVIKFNGTSRKAKDILYIEERFANRIDKLSQRKWVKKGRIVHEYFEKGRKDSLKEHIHIAGKNKPHSPRHLYYWPNYHAECVSHRQVVKKGLIENFEGRPDFLYYRFTAFGGVLCSSISQGPPTQARKAIYLAKGETAKKQPKRQILAIIEKYTRNPEKSAHDDIAEKYLLMDDGRYRLLFHYDDESYIRCKLEFYKELKGFKKEAVDFKPEDSIEYRVDPFTPAMSNYKKFQLLQALKGDEYRACELIRHSEEEIYNTVINRVQEDWSHELDRRDIDLDEQTKQFDEDREDWDQINFASPYLVWGYPRSKEEENTIKVKILQDYRDRIERKAQRFRNCLQEEGKQLRRLMRHRDPELDEQALHEGYGSHSEKIACKMHNIEKRLDELYNFAPKDYASLIVKLIQTPSLNRFAEEERLQEELVNARLNELKIIEEELRRKELENQSCCKLDYFFRYVTKKEKGKDAPAPVDTQPPPPPAFPESKTNLATTEQGEGEE